jgi:hypothetical protein
LTLHCADTLSKPTLVVDLDQPWDAEGVADWLAGSGVRVLNVAGSRESTSPGIYALAMEFLIPLLDIIGPRS